MTDNCFETPIAFKWHNSFNFTNYELKITLCYRWTCGLHRACLLPVTVWTYCSQSGLYGLSGAPASLLGATGKWRRIGVHINFYFGHPNFNAWIKCFKCNWIKKSPFPLHTPTQGNLLFSPLSLSVVSNETNVTEKRKKMVLDPVCAASCHLSCLEVLEFIY